ncbi:MAG: tripartite tricarboxylate transporter substrate binding protein [Betaproteobacteria bacterium]
MRTSGWHTKHALASCAALAAFFCTPHATPAAEFERYPSHTVRIIVSFPAGGAMDSLARVLAPELSRGLGQPVLVDNRPGATGSIGTAVAAKAAPDGHTVLFASNSGLVAPATAAASTDLIQDFVAVTRLVNLPILIACSPSLPAATLPELVALARREPGQLSYATSGIGTMSHMMAVAFSRRAGIELTHIPYGGNRPVHQDVLSGEVPLMMASTGSLEGLVRSGRVRALAISSARRSPTFADVPTIAESGFPGFEMVSWYGAFVPGGTPPEIVDRLHREFVRAMQAPLVRERLASLGMEPVGSAPAEFARELKDEAVRWSALVRDAGARPQ